MKLKFGIWEEIKMEINSYRDKVHACFLGKNIGGTLGAPLECKRGVWDLDFYTEKIDHVLPNDDLDLQLVWLNACETHGKAVDADILSDYWISYIVGDWSEYGACKNNLRAGILPPFSGWYHNHNQDSCGAFIRSELWACLMPGQPQEAVKYALEDAICDHAGEGVYAEIFCTAVESAAFCESDSMKLADIGLSYIPANCAVAKAVNLVIECFQKGMTWKEARVQLLREIPCSFGMYEGYENREKEALPVGNLGFDAPANIGIIMIGWLWGNGDFGKSICISAGCGEDADCTAATLGSILGIIGGSQSIGEKWKAPVGDDIATISINLTNNVIRIPKTVTELVDRICTLAPDFSCKHSWKHEKMCDDMQSMRNKKVKVGIFEQEDFLEYMHIRMAGMKRENGILSAVLMYDTIEAEEGKGLPIRIYIKNKLKMQQWIQLRLYTQDAVSLLPCEEYEVAIDQFHGGTSVSWIELELECGQTCKGRYEAVIEVSSKGRAQKLYFPVVLLHKRGSRKEEIEA